MRFILVDRILSVEKGRGGSFIKNVSQSEDFFSDHFPESPIMPGVLMLESFDQAAQLLIAYGRDFRFYPELARVAKASFRHYVLPGDQLQIGLKIQEEDQKAVVVKGVAEVGGRLSAEATLAFAVIPAEQDERSKARCQRLKDLYEQLSQDLVGRGWENLAYRF